MAKRVVVWGTGFVGKMVIPEVLAHPEFELAGVGVSNAAKVGLAVAEICGRPLNPSYAAAEERGIAPVCRRDSYKQTNRSYTSCTATTVV